MCYLNGPSTIIPAPGMEWYMTWTQAYSSFANRNDYTSAIAQLKQLEENPVCKKNLVN
jgi:hypothetical protein